MAMSGVAPLPDRDRRRASSVHPPPERPAVHVSERRIAAQGGKPLSVRTLPDGSLECSRAGAEFAVQMLDGRPHAEDTLDVHGFDRTAAQLRVREFVRTRGENGRRVVSIVHGHGRHSPDGVSVLRDAVSDALRSPPTSAFVNAFRSSPDLPGGLGATYVALRSTNKK